MTRKGFFFTLDVAISLLLVMLVSIFAFTYVGKLTTNDFDSALQYGYLQDASNVLVKKGCLENIACPVSAPSDECANEVLRATPDSLCVSVSGYNAAELHGDGTVWPSDGSLLFTIDKPGCKYSGGPVQALYFPFSCDGNQTGSSYYRAAVKAWQKGAK